MAFVRLSSSYWSNREAAETRPDRNKYGYSNDVKVRKGTYVFHDPDVMTPAKYREAREARKGSFKNVLVM